MVLIFERTYDWMKSVETKSSRFSMNVLNNRILIFTVACIVVWMSCWLMPIRQVRKKVYRPFIMTEYLHTMGNSGGGLKEYMEVFESEPCRTSAVVSGDCRPVIQREVDAHGKWYWAYGGDYGPENIPSFGNFCCNGLVNAVREPHPHLKEVKSLSIY